MCNVPRNRLLPRANVNGQFPVWNSTLQRWVATNAGDGVAVIDLPKNDFEGIGNGIDDNVAILLAANAIGTGRTMYSGTYKIASNVEITFPLTVLSGAKFLVPIGVTLTISNTFTCGFHHCFTGDGNVIFQGGSVKEAPIQWFGAVSNFNSRIFTNDISSALNKALLCGAVVRIPAGYYYLAHTVTISRPTTIRMEKVYNPYPVVERNDRTVIYTNIDMDFFIIRSSYVWIEGGICDASAVNLNTNNRAAYHIIPSGGPWNAPTNPETHGLMAGGITDFAVVGNALKLNAGNFPENIGNGIVGIYIDWVNAEVNSFLYRQKFHGWFDHVKYGLYETIDGGNGASNACWHDIKLNIWIARQALVLNRSTESDIDVTFQSAPILHTSEKDLAALYFKGVYGHRIKAKLVDMTGLQLVDSTSDYHLGWSHFFSKEDYTGNNFWFKTNSDVDIVEVQAKKVASAVSGLSIAYADGMTGIMPSGNNSKFKSAYLNNILVAANKRYTTSIGYYKKPSDIAFTDITVPSADYPCTPSTDVGGDFAENIWNPNLGGVTFYWQDAAIETDYVEIAILGIENSFIRITDLHITGASSSATGGGIKQIHIVQIGSGAGGDDEIIKNELINCEPANFRDLKYFISLSAQYQTKKIIVRLIGLHNMVGNQNIYINDFAMFKETNTSLDEGYASTAPLVSIAGKQRIYDEKEFLGDVIVGNGSWNSPGKFKLGNYTFWVDSTGKLRIKNGVPSFETDGNLV